MYSLLPAIVSGLFLAYGFYVVATKGFNRVSTGFLLLCVATFFWQATWAVLFQVRDPDWADVLVRFGYLLILFVPASLYHFLVEISGHRRDLRWALVSYGVAALLGIFGLGTDLFVAGYYEYFFGYYPKAGPLHALHVLQAVVVVNRGLYVTYRASRTAAHDQRIRLRLCVASVLIYFFAAVDYLANYGVEFYPPGVVFLAASLGLIAIAVTRYNLLSPSAIAATVAHEMRTPLASIGLQAEALIQWLPELDRGYELALANGLVAPGNTAPDLSRVMGLARLIKKQVDRSNVIIDMMLVAARMEQIDRSAFCRVSMVACVREAVETYPFVSGERDKIHLTLDHDFEFVGSDSLMVYVLFNLLKNALYAIQAAGKGEITISTGIEEGKNLLTFEDTGTGIRAEDLPRIFEMYFTTTRSRGAGIGLTFCRRVMESFCGSIGCSSVEGKCTVFRMYFPSLSPSA